MILVCLSAGLLTTTLHIQAFTLAWMHSVEKIRWEEDWEVVGQTLVIKEARVKGTGAGMEPPLDSKFYDGSWHYKPNLKPLQSVSVMHSPYTLGYEICFDGSCKPLISYLPNINETESISIHTCEK